MRILHYFLGFPPYRTGGLTKYAYDLMLAQKDRGDDVMALWPGTMLKIGGKPRIKKKHSMNAIVNYELVNPLPVPLDEGICEFGLYCKPCDIQTYLDFLSSIRPDIIHIHTLMGLHEEFIDAANQLSIQTIFTSHDYFGICPKVTLFRYGSACREDHGCADCIQCNLSALSMKKIEIMQSPFYRFLKDSWLVKKIRRSHRQQFFGQTEIPEMPELDVEAYAEKYRNLRAYYIRMLEKMSCIHFNSSVSENIYLRYMTPRKSLLMNITHKNITDMRKNPWQKGDKLRLVYLSPINLPKGYFFLKKALDELWEEGQRFFSLRLFSDVPERSPYMIVEENGYQYEELPSIFSEADLLLAPSIWYETFGFTVLEAISYATPVIISDRVGAQDIIGEGGMIIKAGSVEALKEAVLKMSEEHIVYRRRIKESAPLMEWSDFIDRNYKVYNDENI